MSIIKPHTSNKFLMFFAALFAVLLVAGVIYSHEYRVFADGRHETARLAEQLSALEAQHADLADAVFQATGPTAFETVAAASNLSLERHPAYLSLDTNR